MNLETRVKYRKQGSGKQNLKIRIGSEYRISSGTVFAYHTMVPQFTNLICFMALGKMATFFMK